MTVKTFYRIFAILASIIALLLFFRTADNAFGQDRNKPYVGAFFGIIAGCDNEADMLSNVGLWRRQGIEAAIAQVRGDDSLQCYYYKRPVLAVITKIYEPFVKDGRTVWPLVVETMEFGTIWTWASMRLPGGDEL